MKVVAWVPVKLNSERLPNKNVKNFGDGRPLLRHILDTLLDCSGLDARYLFSSEPSMDALLPAGVDLVLHDPALDLPPTRFNDVMREFATRVVADVYVLAHATAPFLSATTIRTGIERVTQGGYDSAFAVLARREFLWQHGRPVNYSPVRIPRTQDLEPFYTETTGLYVYRRELIVNQGRRIGDRPYLLEVSAIEALDINEPIDFAIAEAVYHDRHR